MSQNPSTRHQILFDRILALGSQDLASVERHVTALEAALPAVPGTTRVVAGATVTDRPDSVYAAELAKTGGAQR